MELTLERPEVKNAINWELMRRLRSAIDKVEADASSVPAQEPTSRSILSQLGDDKIQQSLCKVFGWCEKRNPLKIYNALRRNRRCSSKVGY